MKKGTKIGLAATAALAAVTGAAGFIGFNELMNRNAMFTPYLSKLFDKPSDAAAPFDENAPDERKEWFYNYTFEEHELLSDKGERLRGYLISADKPSDIYVFGVHGYRGNGKREFCYMAKFYHDKGYNVFVVDHQAAGESEGKYITFGYEEHKNCMKWLGYVLDTFGRDIQIILHGVSMGSATAMLMTGDENLPDNIKFTVADCGYTSQWNQFAHNISGTGAIAPVLISFLNAYNKAILGFGFKDVSPIDAVKKAKIPMLFIHGEADDFVPCFMIHELYDACASEVKDKLVIPRAGHALSYVIDSAAYEAKVSEFTDRFITSD